MIESTLRLISAIIKPSNILLAVSPSSALLIISNTRFLICIFIVACHSFTLIFNAVHSHILWLDIHAKLVQNKVFMRMDSWRQAKDKREGVVHAKKRICRSTRTTRCKGICFSRPTGDYLHKSFKCAGHCETHSQTTPTEKRPTRPKSLTLTGSSCNYARAFVMPSFYLSLAS